MHQANRSASLISNFLYKEYHSDADLNVIDEIYSGNSNNAG
jgi:hypothetical protein